MRYIQVLWGYLVLLAMSKLVIFVFSLFFQIKQLNNLSYLVLGLLILAFQVRPAVSSHFPLDFVVQTRFQHFH